LVWCPVTENSLI